MNSNSIKGNIKNCEFRALINLHDPHVIRGCESKIDSTYPTYRLFPGHYTDTYRKDHIWNGGIFCAIREDALATEEKDLAKNNNCVWSSIQFPKSQKIYLGSFYRPPRAPLEHLETRDTNEVIGSSDKVNARKLLAITEQFNLTQHQREITRPSSDAVLDLLFCTNPNLVNKVEVVPGISEHLVVLTMLDVRPKLYLKHSHMVYKYKSTNFVGLRLDMVEYATQFLMGNPSSRSPAISDVKSIRTGITAKLGSPRNKEIGLLVV